MACLGLMTAGLGQAQRLAITNVAVSGGIFSFNVLAASNTTFIIQISSNLTGWQSVKGMTSTSILTSVQDPRGVSGFPQQYYRLVEGAVSLVNYDFNFLEFANPGSFNGGTTPSVGFPVTWNSYSAIFNVNNDTNLPSATNVFFTGPTGSGLTNAPADASNSNANSNSGNYQSPIISNPPDAIGGTWLVNYKGSNITVAVVDPQVTNRVVVPYPTLTKSSGNLVNVSWIYRDASTGATLSGPPAYMTSIQLQVYGGSGSLYVSTNLPPSTTSAVVSPSVPISSLSGVGLAYQDTAGNNYLVSYGP
jgi:hypothetical protein